jgi:hypothetical protein
VPALTILVFDTPDDLSATKMAVLADIPMCGQYVRNRRSNIHLNAQIESVEVLLWNHVQPAVVSHMFLDPTTLKASIDEMTRGRGRTHLLPQIHHGFHGGFYHYQEGDHVFRECEWNAIVAILPFAQTAVDQFNLWSQDSDDGSIGMPEKTLPKVAS